MIDVVSFDQKEETADSRSFSSELPQVFLLVGVSSYHLLKWTIQEMGSAVKTYPWH